MAAVNTSDYAVTEPHASVLMDFGGGGATLYYQMMARDAGAVAPGYVVWNATFYDTAGAGYAGGSPAPIGAMVPGSAFAIDVYFGD